MIRRKVAIAAVLLSSVMVGGLAFASGPSASASPPTHAPLPAVDLRLSQTLQRGSQGDAVKILQSVLTNAGWPTWVDGDYGPHTEKTVMLYQRANGLQVDGIAGPETLSHLGIWNDGSAPPAATPATPAVPREQPATPAQPGNTSVGPCSEWTPLAAQVGWPQERLGWLSGIMRRESGCQPTAHNGRGADDSYGLLQINTKGALWGELQWRCGLTSKDQLFDPATNLACGYKLYLAYGTRPWRVG